MKKYLSLILIFLIVLSFPVSVYAKPTGGTTVDSITFNPESPSIIAGSSITITASWKSTFAVNQTQWTVEGSPQTATTMKTAKTSGTSSYTYNSTTTGQKTLTFKFWNSKDLSKFIVKSVIVNVTPATTPAIRYVSLGDSIATGTTTPLTSPTNPYVDQFENYLRSTNPGTDIIRSAFETDGDRTNELLNKLQTNTSMQDAIRTADFITISIGGNNLMQACKTWLGLYDFFNPNLSIAEQGYKDFVAQWEAIMIKIRTLNQDAVVVVMNQYNPFNVADTEMHTFVDNYYFKADHTGMNDLINSLASTYFYEVADVYSAFDQYSSGNMNQVTLLYPSSLTRNPHPNQTGQNIIFGLHKNIYDLLGLELMPKAS